MSYNTRRPTRNNSSSQPDNSENMSVDEKLNLLIEGNQKCLSEIAGIKEDIAQFKKDINESLDMCFDKVKDCENSINKNSSSITACVAVIDGLKSENISLKKTVGELKKRVAAGEQYSRSNCLEIYGVPETKNENIVMVVKQVANALNFKLEDTMIDAVHRLSRNPAKPNNPRGIILKFCRRIDMDSMRQRARVKKSINAADLGYQSEAKVFVNLSLGKETRQLWAEVRKFKDDHNFQYAWITSAGRIFLRRSEGEEAVHVSEASDLDCLK